MSKSSIITRLAACSLLALASAAEASVVYSFTGEYVSERDDEGNTLATSTATWSFTAADFITSASDIVPDSCDSGNAGFFCAATQRMEPYPSSFGGDIGGDYIGLNLDTADGSGTGFYWFQPGAFGAAGTYTNDGWPNPSCGDSGCYGNAGIATLTVSVDNAVPEPAAWAMMIAGFGIVGAGLRRRSVRVAFVTA